MIGPRRAYFAGVLVGGVTATVGWTWLMRHPEGLLARHARATRAWNATHHGAVTTAAGRGGDGLTDQERAMRDSAEWFRTRIPDGIFADLRSPAATLTTAGVTPPEPPCPTCSGPSRETSGMICQTCGTDYGLRACEDEAWRAQDDLARARGWRFGDGQAS